jgi:hypothetical protein
MSNKPVFYSRVEYDQFVKDNPQKRVTPKYYQGLGNIDSNSRVTAESILAGSDVPMIPINHDTHRRIRIVNFLNRWEDEDVKQTD